VRAVGVAENVIDVHPPLIIDGRGCWTHEARPSRGVDGVRPRDQSDQVRDHAVGSGSALPVAEDQAVEINLLRLAEPFVWKEEERLVPDDGASQVAAELIALERRRLSGSNSKEVAGIQSIVAQELEQFAVELAATRRVARLTTAPELWPWY